MNDPVTCPTCQFQLQAPAPECPNCGEPLGAAAPHLPLPPEAARASRAEGPGDRFESAPAGHGNRIGAALIDGLIIVGLYLVVYLVTGLPVFDLFIGEGANSELAQLATGTLIALYSVLIFGPYLYSTLFEASAKQGTPGKMIAGLKVVDVNGHRLSIPRSAGRNLLKSLVGMFQLLHIVILFNKDHRGIHDMLGGTYVVQPGRRRKARG